MLKESHKSDTRDIIIDAAERLLGRFGYSKMTMTDLAEEAGIGVGTTYLHFPGKVEVAMAVLDRYHLRVQSALSEIALSDQSDDAKIHAMLIARIMLRFDGIKGRVGQLDDFRRAIQAVVAERRCQWNEAEGGIFAKVLESGQAAGLFDIEEPLQTAQTLIKATFCMMPKNLSHSDYENPSRVRQQAEWLADLLTRGILRIDRTQ